MLGFRNFMWMLTAMITLIVCSLVFAENDVLTTEEKGITVYESALNFDDAFTIDPSDSPVSLVATTFVDLDTSSKGLPFEIRADEQILIGEKKETEPGVLGTLHKYEGMLTETTQISLLYGSRVKFRLQSESPFFVLHTANQITSKAVRILIFLLIGLLIECIFGLTLKP